MLGFFWRVAWLGLARTVTGFEVTGIGFRLGLEAMGAVLGLILVWAGLSFSKYFCLIPAVRL